MFIYFCHYLLLKFDASILQKIYSFVWVLFIVLLDVNSDLSIQVSIYIHVHVFRISEYTALGILPTLRTFQKLNK